MSSEEFQNGRHGGQLGYRNRTSLAIRNFLDAPMPPKKYLLYPTNRSGAHIDSSDGCHGGLLRYRIGKIFAIKNRHVDPMPPIKFQLNLTFHSGGDVV